MAVFNVSLSYLEDLKLGFENKQTTKLSQFREEMVAAYDENIDSVGVEFVGRCGNDYAVINTGEVYILIALTNYMHYDLGDFICMSEFDTLEKAMNEITNIVVTDAGC